MPHCCGILEQITDGIDPRWRARSVSVVGYTCILYYMWTTVIFCFSSVSVNAVGVEADGGVSCSARSPAGKGFRVSSSPHVLDYLLRGVYGFYDNTHLPLLGSVVGSFLVVSWYLAEQITEA